MSKQQTVRVKVPIVQCVNDDVCEFAESIIKIIEPLYGYCERHSAWMNYTRSLPVKERQRKRRALARIARLAQ